MTVTVIFIKPGRLFIYLWYSTGLVVFSSARRADLPSSERCKARRSTDWGRHGWGRLTLVLRSVQRRVEVEEATVEAADMDGHVACKTPVEEPAAKRLSSVAATQERV